MTGWSNWAGNQTASPVRTIHPRTVDNVRHGIVSAVRDGLRVKAIGSSHSFPAIGVTDGVHVHLDHLDRVLEVDRSTGLVTVEAGISLHRLHSELAAHGLALPNLGDVDLQTLAGATATGTHGTGARHRGIADAVVAMALITATGEIVSCSADQIPDVFAAARIGLGALGVVVTMTLQCVPAFLLHAREEPIPLATVLDGFDELVEGHDHVDAYWFPHTQRTLVKRNDRVDPDIMRQPLGRVRALVEDELVSNGALEVLSRITARRPSLAPRLNALGARLLTNREYVDDSPAVFVSRRRVRFKEMEYALPRDALPSALREVQAWIDRSGEVIGFPVEIRVADADDCWLSPAYGRSTAYIAVHTYHRVDHERYFRAVGAILSGYDGRPHWGKLHYLDAPVLRRLYPRFDDFLAVRDRLDPGRTFGNAYLERVLGP